MTPVALTADIHGNAWALRAVLEDIDRRGVEVISDLGDSLCGPLAPAETADLLIERGIPSIRGNDDSALLETERAKLTASARFTIPRLSPRHLEWIRALPRTRRIVDVLLCHATPHSELDYLLEHVQPGVVELREPASIRALLGVVDARLIACGHTHVPRLATIDEHVTIVNPGSVGLPAYEAELPYPHAMQAGSPHARYAIIAGSHIEHVAVDYDHESAAASAARNSRPDWARWLRTGRG
jgi:predicted phosphodiesterase